MRLRFHMMPIKYNQELKQAANLKNSSKLKEALNILNDFDEEKGLTTLERFQFYVLKSSILEDLFFAKDALNYAELAYEESKEFETNSEIINVLILKSQILRGMLKPHKALEMINEAEERLIEINQTPSQEFKMKKGYILYHKGTCYFNLGVLNSSLRFIGEASKLAKEINDKKLIMYTTKWLGFAYATKGESDHALEYQKRYLTQATELNDKQEIIGAHNTLGMAYTNKGDFKRAIEHLEKGLSLCHEINSWKTFIVSSSLFEAYLKSNSLEKAQQCHDRMGLLVKKGTHEFNDLICRLQEAALLKKSHHKASHSKAEKIFKEVADKETSFIDFKLFALVNLCDLFLTRLKKTSNLKELDDIQPYIDKIRSIAENERVHSLLVELNSLQAKLKLVIFEFKEAQELLAQALNIANMYGLNLLARRVENEQAELSKNFLKWEKLKMSRGKISERMDLARVDEQIQILLQKRNYLKGISSS